ncbi:10400_t:CDS:1, partial [Acaulospora colombiana]
TFWQLARFRIRTALTKAQSKGETDVVVLRRFVKDAAVQMMELEACGVKVDLQYCAAARLAEKYVHSISYYFYPDSSSSWEDVPILPSDSPLFSLPLASLVTLNAYRDVITIKRTVPSLDTFRTAHRALKLFLIRRGIWGARFGYLGGFHLTLLLTRVALLLPPSATPSHLIESFIKTYAQWDWARDMVYPIPSREKEQSSSAVYKRILAKEPMVVLSIERPLSNLTYHASQNSVDSLAWSLKEAHTMLAKGKTLSEVCYVPTEGGAVSPNTDPLKELANNYKAFVRLDVHFWGGNCMKG